ncbi:MAG: exopolysaccharide biosynthesis protein [Pseudomonadota bacterium]
MVNRPRYPDDRAGENEVDGEDASDTPLSDILDKAADASTDGDGRVSVKEVLVALGDRSYGSLFVVLGVASGTPIAIVPGASSLLGFVTFLVAAQMVYGARHVWLPQVILNLSVSEPSLRGVRDRIAPAVRRIDALIFQRFDWAANEAMRRIAGVLVGLLGLLMIPLDFVPFAVAAPAWAAVVLGLAIASRDGLIMLIGVAAFTGSLWLSYAALF